MSVTLTDDQKAALLGSQTRIVRKIDFYNADGTTLFASQVPFTKGDISVDGSRDERRTSTWEIGTNNGQFFHGVGSVWYDKIVKAYRGCVINGTPTLWQCGEFMIDQIDSQHFPHTMTLTCRDYAKKLIVDELAVTTTFSAGSRLEDIVNALITPANVTKKILPVSGITTGKDFTWDAGTTRMKAVNDIAAAYSYEVFFDAYGYFVMRPYLDPASAAVVFSYKTGDAGSIATIAKSSNDSRIYNQIVVTGGDATILPVVGISQNNDPNSPTSTVSLNSVRTYRYDSTFITTQAQAQAAANKLLYEHALEEFSIDLETVVIPTLEATDIIEFIDPEPSPNQPTRFLLHDFNIPFGLEVQKINGRRVLDLIHPDQPVTIPIADQ